MSSYRGPLTELAPSDRADIEEFTEDAAPKDDGCCKGCGACPGFMGVECDGDCEHAQREMGLQ